MIAAVRFDIPDVLLLHYDVTRDDRGASTRVFSEKELAQIGVRTKFVEEILYRPEKAGTLYGIHFQNRPRPQTKMIRCVRGRGLDYAVDLRPGSATYKRWVRVELDAENGRIMYLPPGFGHAFLSLEDGTELLFWIDEPFDTALSRAIRYDDPELSIEYPIQNPILSEQDRQAKGLSETDIDM